MSESTTTIISMSPSVTELLQVKSTGKYLNSKTP